MTHAATNFEATHGHQTAYDHSTTADEVASVRERSLWLRRTSWGAILAGAVSAIGLQTLFTVLGTAIGATTFGTQGTDASEVGTFAGIWWVISGTLSLLVGGIIVGRMISIPRHAELIVHGFTMWAVTAIFGFMFLWSSAGMVGNVGSQTMENTSLMQQANQTMGAENAMRSDSQARASATGMQASAEEVRESASAASWWTLVALLLGVGAAMGGAYIGSAPLGPQTHEDHNHDHDRDRNH